MSNDYFQFKEFRIDQGDCGMKVTTEACVFGALVEPVTLNHSNHSFDMLDIGAGTGLLSLMMAQRFKFTTIIGVEIDADAYRQALLNIKNSKWNNESLIVENSALQNFKTETSFDVIISNPPFFKQHQQPGNKKKAQALHADKLPHSELAKHVNRLLGKKGEFHIILPAYEAGEMAKLLKQFNLFLVNSIHLYNRINDKTVFRVINTFCRVESSPITMDFYIRNLDNSYTQEFVDKLSPFYLHLS